MKTPVENTGSIGIITDLADNDLPANAWTEGRNVVFRDGRAKKVPGYEEVYVNGDLTKISPLYMIPFTTPTTYFWVYAGTDDIYKIAGTTHSDISRAAGYNATADFNWNGGILGGVLFMNNGTDTPQKWSGTGLMADLTNWNYASWTGNSCRVLRPYKQFLVALDYTKDDGGTPVRYPFMVKWSHPADPGSEPSSWDETDTTKRAGEWNLMDSNGFIIDCLPLRGVNMVYKEDSVHTMRFIGGNNVFAFDQLFSDFGLLSTRCVKPLPDTRHFCVGSFLTADIVIHDGNTKFSVVDKKVREAVYGEIDETTYNRSFVAPNYLKDEMWFCYPTSGATYPTKAMVYNWKSNTIGFRDLPGVSHIAFGISNDSTLAFTYDGMGPTDTYDSATGSLTYDARSYSPTSYTLLMTDATNQKIYQAETTNTEDGSNMTVFLRRTGIDLAGLGNSGIVADYHVMKELVGVWPKVKNGPVNVNVGIAQTPDGPYNWSGIITFDPTFQYKVDCRLNGRYLAVEFSSSGNVDWTLDGYSLDIIPGGER